MANGAIGRPDFSFVIRMDSKTSGMSARTGQLMKLKGIYNEIVIFLRKVIAFFDGDSYHNYGIFIAFGAVRLIEG